MGASPWAAGREELRRAPRAWLVTGAAGFIGSHLVEQLLLLDQRVAGLDDLSTGSRSNLEDVRQRVGEAAWGRFRFHAGDVRDGELLARLCAPAPLVLHQAALGSVPRSVAAPLDSVGANVEGSVRVLEAARAAGVPRVVYASSSSVYGNDARLPKREERVGEPLSPYAATKRAVELFARAAHRTHGQRCVGLRYFNVFGPRQRPDGPYAAVVPRWIDALAGGRPACVFGDGGATRDFCPVANVVQANLLAALAPARADGEVFNVALGGSTTLLELYGLLRDGLVARGLRGLPPRPRPAPARPGDVRHSRADLARAAEVLGYRPEVGLAEGVARTLDAFVERAPGAALTRRASRSAGG